MPPETTDKRALAKSAARAMWRHDRASKWLGMRIEEVRPGYARLSMPVSEQMANSRELCHGGLIFALADSAFAFACNSRGQVAVAASASIEYLAPGYRGDLLTAEASEAAQRGRSGLYDVRVVNQKGELIALFRGRSAALRETWAE